MVSDTVTRRYRPGRFRPSPLTLRIMAVNMAAILTLALGVLYTGQYERELIDAELAALSNEGRLYAAALAEGGVRENLSGGAVLATDLSRHMLRKLIEGRDVRAMLFNRHGKLIADSHQMLSPGGLVQVVPLLPPKGVEGLRLRLDQALDRFLHSLPTRIHLPVYPEPLSGMIGTYPHALETLSGLSFTDAWRDRDGGMLLTATVPVQRLKNVLGAVLLVKTATSIEEGVRTVQLTVLKIFLLAFAVTVLLSVYLSATIGRPVMRLAEAARRLREDPALTADIPDLSGRQDEIGMLSVALREMTEALSQRMTAIENFAADVAHELKNPLASVRSAVETFDKVKDPARRARLLEILHEDIGRMDRLISDISSASRLDAELARQARERVDLAALLSGVLDAADQRAAGRVIFRRDLPAPDALFVLAHPGQLGQVFVNILDNAVSFTPQGGAIAVRAHAEKNGEAVVGIENEGPPIPERNLERIFERFYTQRPEGEEFGRHSGLGLSISRQIVRAHGGTIKAANVTDDKGQHRAVCFTVRLPVMVGK